MKTQLNHHQTTFLNEVAAPMFRAMGYEGFAKDAEGCLTIERYNLVNSALIKALKRDGHNDKAATIQNGLRAIRLNLS